MAFLDEINASRTRQIEDRIAQEESAARDQESITSFNTAINTYLNNYSNWAKKNNGKFANSSREDIEKRIRNFVMTAGKSDGEISDESSEVDIARYGAKFLNDLSGLKEDGSEYTFKDYLNKYGSDDEKNAAGRQLGAMAVLEKYRNGRDDGAQTPLSDRDRRLIFEAKNSHDSDMKWLNTARTKYGTWQETNSRDLYDIFENYESYMPDKTDAGKTDAGKVTGGASTNSGKEDTSSDTITFTISKANDPNYKGLGQKIVDLGLATDKGLWGSDGDVQFYTKQLYEQGAVDSRGNLKVGVPIKLKKRKTNK